MTDSPRRILRHKVADPNGDNYDFFFNGIDHQARASSSLPGSSMLQETSKCCQLGGRMQLQAVVPGPTFLSTIL